MSGWEYRWVGQDEPNGCVAATLAAILGLNYREAAELLAERRQGDCYSTVAQYQQLWARGWITEARGRQRGEDGMQIGPWPPEPFADAHIASVKVSPESTLYHSVLWLRDGRVLDPLTTKPRSLGDYHHVGGITGLTPPDGGTRGGPVPQGMRPDPVATEQQEAGL